MYAVFINASRLTFGNSPDIKANDNLFLGNTVPYELLVQQLERAPIPIHLNVVADDPKVPFLIFSGLFTPVKAAGGLVRRDDGKLLWIHRLGKWDLPKGKMEPGEDARECALREVEEETGLRHLTLEEELPSTWHMYKQHQRTYLKETVWFGMRAADGHQPLTPQKEEGIEEVVWKTPEESKEALPLTYPSLVPLVKALLP